jgi:hypothetical protein
MGRQTRGLQFFLTPSGAWLKANLRVVRPEDIIPEYMPSVVASNLGQKGRQTRVQDSPLPPPPRTDLT